ncbi:MAG: iron ABC transporter permease [Treponemataceae bacterium]
MPREKAVGLQPGIFLVISALPVIALTVAFILPYAAAVSDGFTHFTRIVMENSVLRVLRFTIAQAAFSTLAALTIGLPGAWLIGSGRFRGARIVRAVASVPFAMPPILVVLGFVLFFGNNGWANKLIMNLTGAQEPPLRILYRPEAIILAHAFYNFPIILRLVGDAIAKARSTYAPVASGLGASGSMTFLTVLVPIAFPSIAAAALLVFLYCFTSFAVVLVLGGGPGATTLPVEIYRAARISLDYSTAGSLALLETMIAAIAYLAYTRMEQIARRVSGANDDRTRETAIQDRSNAARGSPIANLLTIIYIIAAMILVAGPISAVVAESFLSRVTRTSFAQFSLRWWASIGSSAVPALIRSVLLAAAAATVSVFLASAAALAVWKAKAFTSPSMSRTSLYERAVSALCMAPLASSGIVLGLGWLKLYGSGLARSFWVVALAHAISALPFAYRSISEGLRSLPSQTAAASASLGAEPLTTAFRVALPSAAKRIRSAWAFAAAISLGELNAVLMLGLENYETLPLLMYRAAGAYRFGAACAAGVLLAIACIAAFVLSEDTAHVD